MTLHKNSFPRLLAAASLCLTAASATRAQPADAPPAPSITAMDLDQLLTQLRTAGPATSDGEKITKEIAARGNTAYDTLLKHVTTRDEFYDPSLNALLLFPKFADILLTTPETIPQSAQLLTRMKANAVPALLRLLASPDESKRALALSRLCAIARTCPDEADRQFTPILTAPPDVKPRLIAAQGLVTGLWTKDAQEATLQQLAHGDAAMAAALLSAIRVKALPLDEAGPAWLKAAQSATDPQVLGNLLEASAALRPDDLPAAIPVLLNVLKNLKPDTDIHINAALPTVLATLKRGGKTTITALPDLLRAAPARDAAIDLCTQLGAEASPVAANLATLLDAADCPPERTLTLLAALAAMGPAAKTALPSIQKITDPAFDKPKKHALLMLQDGWSASPVPDWKPTRIRRGKLTPRPSADADIALAIQAVDSLRSELQLNPNITPPELRNTGIDGLFALAGDIDDARRAGITRVGAFNAAIEARLFASSSIAMLHAGKHDLAVDQLTTAVGRYRLALMSDPSVAARLDFTDVAIAQVQSGDIEAMLKLVRQVPVNLSRLVAWQGAHQDLEGAMETATSVPYGPQRASSLAAAAIAFANAGRSQDAAHACTLALDAVHAAPINESQLAEYAQKIAAYSDPGVTPAMLRGFYSPDDRDLSVNARFSAIDQMIGRGNIDNALQLILAAPPPDPNMDPLPRLAQLGSSLHPSLALGANGHRGDAKTVDDKVRKELDALYDAAAKRPSGRDAAFANQYFNVVATLTQVYFNTQTPRDAASLLKTASAQLLELQPNIGPTYTNLANMLVRQLSQSGNFAAAQSLAEKLPADMNAASVWCSIAEQQFAQDGAAAQRSWQKAEAAGAGSNAAQATQLITSSRARAQAGSPSTITMAIGVGRTGTGPSMPQTGPQGKTLEDAAHAVADPAARIPAILALAQQFQSANPQPNQSVIERRLPPEYATLMREAETKLIGNTADAQNLRAQALNICLLTGQIENLDARVQAFAAAVQNGPTLPAKAAATAPAFNINNVSPFILKTLAATQSATGHAADAAKWIDTLTDPGLRAQIRLAEIRGLILRISDILLASQD